MSRNIISANVPALAKQKSLDHDYGFVEVLRDSHKKIELLHLFYCDVTTKSKQLFP